MIDFAGFIMEDGIPIYLQILLYLKRGIAAGIIQDGDELPSRRMLSALLGVNPNTVQKAYHLLEEEELICSHSGAKSYMVLDEAKTAAVRSQLVAAEARNAVERLRRMGLSRDEVVALIHEYWE